MKGFEAFVRMTAARFEQRAMDRALEGSVAASGVYRRVADELVADFEAWRDEEVTPEQAASLSNYSAHGLRQWMRRHKIERLTVGILPFRPLVGAMDERDDEPVATPTTTPRRRRAARKAVRPVAPTLSGAVLATLGTTLTMGVPAALAILREHSGIRLVTSSVPAEVQEAYRIAAARTHPDVNDGDRAAWDQVEAAYRILRGGTT